MIMPDDDIICKNPRRFGFSALYECCEDSTLAAGVTLTAIMKGVTYIFQIADTTDIFKESSFPVEEGSLFEFLEAESLDIMGNIPLVDCRFPTSEELAWYNRLPTV